MTTTTRLWDPTTIGRIPLEYRLAVATMTRSRSTTILAGARVA